VTVSGFDRLLSGNATNYRRNNTRLARCSPTLRIRAAGNGQSCAKYAPSAFTDEVNCIVDNEKQKAVFDGRCGKRALHPRAAAVVLLLSELKQLALASRHAAEKSFATLDALFRHYTQR
jgi:hypothetical protein